MGISALFTGLVDAIGITGTAGAALATGLEAATIGGVLSAATGGNFLKGALTGGLTGGIGSLAGGLIGDVLPGIGKGLTSVIGDVIGGIGASAITGQNIGKGALGGLEMGLATQALGGAPKTATAASPTPGGGVSSAAGVAAPASLGAGAADPNAVTAGLASSTSPTALASGGSGLPGEYTPGAGSLGTGGGGSGLPGSVGAGAATGAASDATGLTASFDKAFGTGGSAGSSSPSLDLTSGSPPVTVSGVNSGVDLGVPTIGTATTTPTTAQTGATKVGGGLFSDPKTALVGLGLAGTMLKGNQQPTGYNQILGAANQATQQGTMLEGYLQSGNLPPGLQSSLDTATNAAISTIRSRYAARGMSGSSAEAQDIQNAKLSAFNQGAQLAVQLYQQGANELQIGDQLYAQIMQASIQRDQETASAIGNFSAALAGLSRSSALAAA